MKAKFEENELVFWSDPDNGLSSGEYIINKVISENGEDSIYYISNGFSEAEVYQSELSEV